MDKNLLEQARKNSLLADTIKYSGIDYPKYRQELIDRINQSTINIYSEYDNAFKLNEYKNTISINLNTFDVDSSTDGIDDDNLGNRTAFLKAIPCFSKGILKIKGSADAFNQKTKLTINHNDKHIKFARMIFYYSIIDLHITDKDCSLTISILFDNHINGERNPAIAFPIIAKYSLNEDKYGNNKLAIDSECDKEAFMKMSEIIKKYDKSKKLIEDFNVRLDHLSKYNDRMNTFMYQLAKFFVLGIVWSNELMQQQKDDIEENKVSNHKKGKSEVLISNKLNNKTFSTKVIEGNGISIKCVNKSELTSKKYSIVTYKTPSWPVRGYLRHYKNGKVVYVKECVRVRKVLKDKATLKDQQYQKIIIK